MNDEAGQSGVERQRETEEAASMMEAAAQEGRHSLGGFAVPQLHHHMNI